MNREAKEGGIEVITGPMYSEKTGELIRRIKRHVIGSKDPEIFSVYIPVDDSSSEENSIIARDIKINKDNKIERVDGNKLPAKLLPVNDEGVVDRSGIRLMAEDVIEKEPEIVGIDEVGFFDPVLYKAVKFFSEELNIRVIATGLDMTFQGEPFETTSKLMSIADRIDKQKARCEKCGKSASRTQKYLDGEPAHYKDRLIEKGEDEKYAPVCKKHHKVRGKPDFLEELKIGESQENI